MNTISLSEYEIIREREKNRAYRLANYDTIREREKAYELTREKRPNRYNAAKQQAYYLAHKEEKLKKQKEYRLNNLDKVKAIEKVSRDKHKVSEN